MAMRTLMGLTVIRPADAAETAVAWKIAMQRSDGPTALCLTRQGLPVLDRGVYGPAEGIEKGGYILSEAGADPELVIIASGSEVSLALEAQARLEDEGIPTRVVNLASWDLFDAQDVDYKLEVLPDGLPKVSVEAGITMGWERYVGLGGASVGIDRYGLSAPGKQVAEALGLTVDAVVEAAKGVL
jgi:transketolase